MRMGREISSREKTRRDEGRPVSQETVVAHGCEGLGRGREGASSFCNSRSYFDGCGYFH